MDISFNCPNCEVHITADDSMIGEEITCPMCGEIQLVVNTPPSEPSPESPPEPEPEAAPAPPPEPEPEPEPEPPPEPPPPAPVPFARPATVVPRPATVVPPSTASKEAHKPAAAGKSHHSALSVPQHSGPVASLVKKKAVDESKAAEGKKIRTRCIKRSMCVEVGHDRFDEVVTDFLNKIGEENIISLSPLSYAAPDSIGHLIPDYGVMIVYRG